VFRFRVDVRNRFAGLKCLERRITGLIDMSGTVERIGTVPHPTVYEVGAGVPNRSWVCENRSPRDTVERLAVSKDGPCGHHVHELYNRSHQMSDETEFIHVAEEAARTAGDVLESWSKKFTVKEKSRSNLVTEADFAAQEAIHSRIHEQFPEHNFLGEEGLSETNSDSPYRWVIDPLDGTSNYVHRFPYYAVSIGLERAEQLILGVIFDPNRNEMFSAVRGQGAALNGHAIRPSGVEQLSDAMVMASLPVAVGNDDPAIARFLNVIPEAQTVQRTGSAALNLACVASGRIDAFWSSSLKPWDMAAGALLVEEAGGRVTRMDGGSFSIEVPDLLSSNGSAIHTDLGQLLE